MRLHPELLSLPTAALLAASAVAQGPIILMGRDGERFPSHGEVSTYAEIVRRGILADTFNGGEGILVIGGGKDESDLPTTFWNMLGAQVGESVTHVHGAEGISSQSFSGFKMLAVVSSIFELNPGGLTNSENGALAMRAEDIAAFLNGGGGLFGFTQTLLSTRYDYLSALGYVTARTRNYIGIEPTPAGEAIGITDDGLPFFWHEEYLAFPSFMEVLAVSDDFLGDNEPAVIGFLVDEFVDIKPGSCPNSFNRTSNGVLPVALVGTDTFDVAQVDLSTVRLRRADGVGGEVVPLDGPQGPHPELEDVARPFPGLPCDCHQLTGDGILDLSLKFRSQDVVDALGLVGIPGGTSVELELSGALLDGAPFGGTDCIRLVPLPPGALLAVESNVAEPYIDVAPLDLLDDAGGFESFTRAYPPGTVVTVTAPATCGEWVFVGWGLELDYRGPRTRFTPGFATLWSTQRSVDIPLLVDRQRVQALFARLGLSR